MADEAVVMTSKQMEMMFSHLAKLNKEQAEVFMGQMAHVIQELKKPSATEQAKMDKEKADFERKMQNRMMAAKAEEQGKEMRKRGCSHAMPNGHHTWTGAVNQDGFWRPTCSICQTQLAPIRATGDQIKEGINLHLYKAIDMAMLEEAAKRSEKQEALRKTA